MPGAILEGVSMKKMGFGLLVLSSFILTAEIINESSQYAFSSVVPHAERRRPRKRPRKQPVEQDQNTPRERNPNVSEEAYNRAMYFFCRQYPNDRDCVGKTWENPRTVTNPVRNWSYKADNTYDQNQVDARFKAASIGKQVALRDLEAAMQKQNDSTIARMYKKLKRSELRVASNDTCKVNFANPESGNAAYVDSDDIYICPSFETNVNNWGTYGMAAQLILHETAHLAGIRNNVRQDISKECESDYYAKLVRKLAGKFVFVGPYDNYCQNSGFAMLDKNQTPPQATQQSAPQGDPFAQVGDEDADENAPAPPSGPGVIDEGFEDQSEE